MLTACYPLTRYLLSDASVLVKGDPDVTSSLFIIPGNHSIRLLDFRQNKSIVLHKIGFDPQFFKSVIHLKSSYPFLPTPKLIDSSSENGWYAEELVSGLPLNRLSSPLDRSTTFNAARDALLVLYEKSLEYIECKMWTNSLSDRIFSLVDGLTDIYDTSFVENINFLVSTLSDSVLSSQEFFNKLPLSMSHGDFNLQIF